MSAGRVETGAGPKRGESSSESGVVLLLCLAMVAVLCFIAGTTLSTLRPEVKGSGNSRNERKAFYNAEAGVQYGIDCISRDLAGGTLALTARVETVNYSAPAGYDFDTIKSLHRLADETSYSMTVTGRCMDARAVIEVSFRRPQLMSAGAFGNIDLQMQPNIELYSFDSRITTNPTPASSTGDANAASNGNITVRPGVVLDGVFMLGEDEFGISPAPISGYENQSVGPMPSDPLGVNTGMLAAAFSHYSDPANNDNAAAGISAEKISLNKNGDSMSVPGGHYYLTDIYLAANATLNLTGTPSDPVVFYLDGPMEAKPNSSLNVVCSKPTSFFIFSVSDQDIKLYPNNDFMGMIYAPNAYIDMHPNNTAKGVFFGNEILILPGAESFIDTALLGKFKAPYVETFQWRHIID